MFYCMHSGVTTRVFAAIIKLGKRVQKNAPKLLNPPECPLS